MVQLVHVCFLNSSIFPYAKKSDKMFKVPRILLDPRTLLPGQGDTGSLFATSIIVEKKGILPSTSVGGREGGLTEFIHTYVHLYRQPTKRNPSPIYKF